MTDDATPAPDAAALAAARDTVAKLTAEVGRVVVGQDTVVREVLVAMCCRGHAVLVGVPGLAKTLLVSTIAKTMSLSFNRIQFTPDLMPSDITGTDVIDEDRATGKRAMRFVQGPIFANLILADEINRTPPKTQAALLEAMQERHVTAGGQTMPLPDPFFVLATQNPIEQEGTYPLPEAQLDRFMFMIRVGYPTESEEMEVIRRTTRRATAAVDAVVDGVELLRLQQLVRDVAVPEHIARYALRLVRATRTPEPDATEDARPDFVRTYLRFGAGPRASQNLILAAKAYAVLDGRGHVIPDDVRAAAVPVLRHRVATNFNAEAEGIDSAEIVSRLLAAVPVGLAEDDQDRAILRHAE